MGKIKSTKKVKKKMSDADKAKRKEEKAERNAFLSEQFKQLRFNIMRLRMLYEETQEELATAIGDYPSAIGNYELGKRIPSRNELYLIAKHYHVSISSLVYGDFSNAFIENDLLINDASNRRVIYSTLLPIVYSDEDLENANFKEAFELHNKIYEALCEDDTDFALLWIDKCTRLYKKAVEDDIITARANLLWWPMFRCIGASALNKKIANSKHLLSKDATSGDVFKAGFLMDVDDLKDQDFEKKQAELIDSYFEDIICNIYWLKNTHDLAFCELGDYYIAIGYMYNIISTGKLSKEQNREVGEEMLQICNLMRNPYAENFYSVFKNPQNYVKVK